MASHPTTARTHRESASVAPVLRWIFQRGGETLTCEVDASGRRYEVCLVPHRNVNTAVIESFGGLLPALERHADLAGRLRDAGWAVVDHVPPHSAIARPLAA